MIKILFSLLIISVLVTITTVIDNNYTSFAQLFNNKTQGLSIFYGCEKYTGFFHCDRLHNKFESIAITGHSSQLFNVTDTPNFTQGNNDKALLMHASSLKSITFSNTSTIAPKQFSIAFWIKGLIFQNEPESPSFSHIVSQMNGDKTSGWSFDMINMNNISNQKVHLTIYDSKGQEFHSQDVPIFNNNTFTQITGTFNGSSIKIYKNGVLFGETEFNGMYNNDINIPLRLGSAANNPMLYYWTGAIDDLQLYNKTLTADEQKQIFNNVHLNTTNFSKNLIGYWKFDSNLIDYSGNKHDGKEHTLISSMVFAPDGRLFFAEKDTGNVKIMEDGKVNPEPFVSISDYHSSWEQGLLGLAIDPEYEINHFVYLFYTTLDKETNEPFNRLVRFTDLDNKGVNESIILDKIPASNGYHSGGALAFAPDGKLYITIGDATQNIKCGNLSNSTNNPCPAQDPSSLLGKVLRINKDGSIPIDNPYPNSPVYNLGHINMYGIAFDKTGFGIVSENGDQLYDEINTIEKKGNYGAPTLQPLNENPELSTNSIKPLRTYYITKCLTNVMYYDGNKVPQLKNKFLIGNLASNIINGYIYAIQLDETKKQIIKEELVSLNNFPNNEAVALAQSPDGEIYYGGYSINKLDSVNHHNERQLLFPIEIKYTTPFVNVNNIFFAPSNNTISLDIDTRLPSDNSNNVSKTNSVNISNTLSLHIPKQIMNKIYSISDSTIENKNITQQYSYKNINYNIIDSPYLNETIANIIMNKSGHQRLTVSGNLGNLDS